MSDPVLIEGRNLMLAEGTGIATYAAVLAETLRGLGHRLDVLVDTPVALSRRVDMNEILLLDALGRQARPDFPPARFAEWLLADPWGVGARAIGPSAALRQRGVPAALEDFELRHGVTRLFERAERHARRTKRPLTVRPARRAKLFHATHPTAIRVKGCANLVTIHDLVPLRLPFATLDAKRSHLATLKAIARHADRIVTVSEHSKREIVALLGVREDRIAVTYQATRRGGVAEPIEPDLLATMLSAFGLKRAGYLLFLGAVEPKKNVERLIDAYLASGVRRPLVIAGRNGWSHGGVDARLAALAPPAGRRRGEAGPRILRLPWLAAPLAEALLQGARAFLFPSLSEGFGLPALEAMEAGVPVLAGRGSALPEIVGPAGLLVDPFDRADIAEKLRTIDGDAGLRDHLRAAGLVQAQHFSREVYAARLRQLYTEFC